MSSDGRRLQRVEKEIRQILSQYLISKLSGSTQSLLSVTRVHVSPDLKHGRVYLSLLGHEGADKEGDWDLLEKELPLMQRHLGKELKLKYTPKIKLFLDHGFDEAEKINSILNDINKSDDLELNLTSKSSEQIEE